SSHRHHPPIRLSLPPRRSSYLTDSFLNFYRSSAVTLKVECLYVNHDRNTRNQGAFVINAASNVPAVYSPVGRRSDEFAVVRAGLNYKFGSY
ncbi:hypothetical protein MKK82_29540, partial [Methylobacterium sp. E-046]|nr:hypothetical protein [Methylobacterium sp. E-046]